MVPTQNPEDTQYAWDPQTGEEVHIGYREDWADRRGTRWMTRLRDDAEIAEHSSWGRSTIVVKMQHALSW